MSIREHQLAGEVQGALLKPDPANGLGMIILTGSSGRVDVERGRLFADLGATVLAQRWWGGDGQAKGINEIPLEVLARGIDLLQNEGCDRIAVLGTSYGAGAALSIAARDNRVDVVIAISPCAVVWQNFGPGIDGFDWPPRSAFSWAGEPLPFVVWDPRAWPAPRTPNPIYRPMYEMSLKTFAEDVAAATIPVENTRAEVILVAGAADALWPSDSAAREIAARLAQHGKRVSVVEHPDAGHNPVFPGETQRSAPPERAWGGTPAADRELGAAAWIEITRRLGLVQDFR